MAIFPPPGVKTMVFSQNFMTKEKYELNDEQWQAIIAPSPTICMASAGGGKTRALIAKIRYLLDNGSAPHNVLAVTFTNKAANEMKERLKIYYSDLSGMQICTIHSMCVNIIKKFIQHTPLKYPFSIYDDGDQLSVIKTIIKARGLLLNPQETLSVISQRKSEEMTEHLEKDMAFIYTTYQRILLNNNALDFDDLLLYARNCLIKSDCKNYYNDLWKHILVDEFQDLSNIQFEIVMALYDPNKIRTFYATGDQNQCVIEGTKIITPEGEVSIKDIKCKQLLLSGSGNTNTMPSIITDIFKRYVVNLPMVTIETASGKKITTTENHVHFAEFIEFNKKFYTYLMYKKGIGYRIGITGSSRNNGKYGLKHSFKARLNQERADYIWLLKENNTRVEAQYFEQLYSVKYGIPTWIFQEVKSKFDHIKQALLDQLFHNIDTETGAKKLLKDLHISYEHPHHISRFMTDGKRRNFSIFLCGAERLHKGKLGALSKGVGKRGASLSNHYFLISFSDKSEQQKFIDMGFNVRHSKDRKGYTAEGDSADLSKLFERAKEISSVIKINIFVKGHFSDTSLQTIPATNILPGMTTFVFDGKSINLESIKQVTRSLYSGYIYDLNIDKVHNYIANGIVTHNSIYGWRGARPENMNDFIKKYKPTICHLTYNYRSGSEIIDHANRFLQYGPPMVTKATSSGMVSFTQFQSQEEEAEKIAGAVLKMQNYEGTAILFRVNARTILFEKTFAQKKIPYKIVGTLPFYKRKIAKDLLSYCKAAVNPDDIESLARIVNVPKRGFGETKQERLLLEGRSYLYKSVEEVPRIRAFIDLLEEIKNKSPLEAIRAVLHQTDYRSSLKTDDDQIMVDSFLDVVSGFDSIEELILASNFIEKDSGHGVRLMSAHASKGLEFDRVFVVGVEDELWPHKFSENIDEERRLFYVACTRAKVYLNISYAKSRICRGKKIDVIPSSLFIDSYKALKK